MITTPLRILLIENNEGDVLIIDRTIRKIVANPAIKVVDNLEDCRNKMINFVPDVVISDYDLPNCNGLEVLELVQKFDKSLPFIFLTGSVNDDELAANTILSGAWGYILKKHMDTLEERLRPLLKKVVFNMNSHHEVRERLRKNKMAINQIYHYLEGMRADNKEQKEDIGKIKDSLQRFKMNDKEADGKIK